ncbi:MAG: stage V sporulation protein S [Candidatus Goldiibacteriota bacterium]
MESITLKVSAKSNPKSVAGSIVNNIREGKTVDIVAMGANAVNQTVKAIAIAGEYAQPEGYDVLCRPGFTHLEIEGETRSAVKISVIAGKK